MNYATGALSSLFLALGAAPVLAANLQVAPVTLEIPPPGATTTVTLKNGGDRPLTAQLRVVRWRQVEGEDDYQPTEAVVASPPLAELSGNQSYTVRIVRADQSPVVEEESYRLIVDELPSAAAAGSKSVNLQLRYSIPVFFYAPDAEPPKLTWRFRKANGRIVVTLRNDGGRHVRISGLKLKDRSGAVVSFGNGLIGYALAHSEAQWTSQPAKGLAGDTVALSAVSDQGPIDGEATAER
jgi:fimbrial chaperone protein